MYMKQYTGHIGLRELSAEIDVQLSSADMSILSTKYTLIIGCL